MTSETFRWPLTSISHITMNATDSTPQSRNAEAELRPQLVPPSPWTVHSERNARLHESLRMSRYRKSRLFMSYDLKAKWAGEIPHGDCRASCAVDAYRCPGPASESAGTCSPPAPPRCTCTPRPLEIGTLQRSVACKDSCVNRSASVEYKCPERTAMSLGW